MKYYTHKGFTLVELLITIAIIGVLASIVMNTLQPIRRKGRDVKRQTDLRAIITAMAGCYDDEGCGRTATKRDYWVCPTTTSADASALCSGTEGGTTTGWNFSMASYLNIIPGDPTNTGGFVYSWINNDILYGGSSSEDAGQWYCIYALVEANPGSYYLATPRGLQTVNTLPAALNCLEL